MHGVLCPEAFISYHRFWSSYTNLRGKSLEHKCLRICDINSKNVNQTSQKNFYVFQHSLILKSPFKINILKLSECSNLSIENVEIKDVGQNWS